MWVRNFVGIPVKPMQFFFWVTRILNYILSDENSKLHFEWRKLHTENGLFLFFIVFSQIWIWTSFFIFLVSFLFFLIFFEFFFSFRHSPTISPMESSPVAQTSNGEAPTSNGNLPKDTPGETRSTVMVREKWKWTARAVSETTSNRSHGRTRIWTAGIITKIRETISSFNNQTLAAIRTGISVKTRILIKIRVFKTRRIFTDRQVWALETRLRKEYLAEGTTLVIGIWK